MATTNFTNKISPCRAGSSMHRPQGLPDGSDSTLPGADNVLPPEYMEEDVVQPESESDGEGGTEAPVVVGDTEALEMHYVPIPTGHVHTPVWGIQMGSRQQSAVIGTQESRTPFPEVFTILPSYFESDVEEGSSGSDNSGSEWLGQPTDFLETDDEEDIGIDECTLESEPVDCSQPFEQWSQNDESYGVEPLSPQQFLDFYDESNWCSDDVKLRGTRDCFLGPKPGPNLPESEFLPTPYRLFMLFWAPDILEHICNETNRYSRTKLPNGKTKGGRNWTKLTVTDLKAWLGILILMGIKRLPRIRHYWQLSEEFLFCQVIPRVMTYKRWEAIQRCLHLINNDDIIRDRKDVRFDPLAKSRWLVDRFVSKSQEIYNCAQECTVDELIIPYKGKYCNIRQFMKDKPNRFGLKVWCFASAKSSYVMNLEVYMGKGTGLGPDGQLGSAVVRRMSAPFQNLNHILICDNFFTSVRLFHELLCNGIFASGTVMRNRAGLPSAMSRPVDRSNPGSIVIKMHRNRHMVAISWQDKELVTMLSTGADAWSPDVVVLRRKRGRAGRMVVPSTPVHLQYQTFMRGVDVTDQLRTTYSCQLSSHKWWKKILCFVVDQQLVNARIIHNECYEDLGMPLIDHMHFNMSVANGLLADTLKPPRGLVRRAGRGARPPCGPAHSTLRRKCVRCGQKQHHFCPGCDYIWLCTNKGCYTAHHEELRRRGARR